MRGKKIVQLCMQNNSENEEKTLNKSNHKDVVILKTAQTDEHFVNSSEPLEQLLNIPNSEMQSTDSIFTASLNETIRNTYSSTANTDDFTILGCSSYDGIELNNDIIFSLNSSSTTTALLSTTDKELNNSKIEFDGILYTEGAVVGNPPATLVVQTNELDAEYPLITVVAMEEPVGVFVNADNQEGTMKSCERNCVELPENVQDTEDPIKKRKTALSFDEDPGYVPDASDECNSDTQESSGEEYEDAANRPNTIQEVIGEFQDAQNSTHADKVDTEEQQLTKKGNPRKRRKLAKSVKERKLENLEKKKQKYRLLAPCEDESCRLKCTNKINENRRQQINSQYWDLNWTDRRNFIINNTQSCPIKRPSTNQVRKQSYEYFLNDENRQRQKICKTFFLTTLGFKRSNDWIIYKVLNKTKQNRISAEHDKRGKHAAPNKISRNEINQHIESYQPCISHYRKEHAPNVRYLPSDVTVIEMHKDFLTKFPGIVCSYDLYRKTVKEKKISFTKLGHEECKICQTFTEHSNDHSKENLDQTCAVCNKWSQHNQRANKARQVYRDFSTNAIEPENLVVSADLQKVLMLPRIDTFKRVLFTKRLTVYNETFVPLGKKSKELPLSVIWNEAICGRSKEDIISTFYSFFLKNRDKNNIIVWLDNCAGQNKNWALLTFLIYIINSEEISAENIEFYYFEPGHTFMSADHYHHQIELSLKHSGKIYDFNDFADAIKKANNGKSEVKQMNSSDFLQWPDCSSLYKINKLKPRPLLHDMVHIKAEKGNQVLKYRTSFDEELIELDFLHKKSINKLVKPRPNADSCHGVPEDKKRDILDKLVPLMPANRRSYWENLQVLNK